MRYYAMAIPELLVAKGRGRQPKHFRLATPPDEEEERRGTV
jgi:hypothetical protein